MGGSATTIPGGTRPGRSAATVVGTVSNAARGARPGCVFLAGALLLVGCGGLAPMRSFGSIGDFATTTPPSRAEGGQSTPVNPPAGFAWSHRVDAYVSGSTTEPEARFEFQIDVTDLVPTGDWRFDILPDQAQLVDDQGGRFPCTSARLPDPQALAEEEARLRAKGEPRTRRWTLRFDLPDAYRPSAMNVLVVHWSYRVGTNPPVRVTSRFRI